MWCLQRLCFLLLRAWRHHRCHIAHFQSGTHLHESTQGLDDSHRLMAYIRPAWGNPQTAARNNRTFLLPYLVCLDSADISWPLFPRRLENSVSPPIMVWQIWRHRHIWFLYKPSCLQFENSPKIVVFFHNQALLQMRILITISSGSVPDHEMRSCSPGRYKYGSYEALYKWHTETESELAKPKPRLPYRESRSSFIYKSRSMPFAGQSHGWCS